MIFEPYPCVLLSFRSDIIADAGAQASQLRPGWAFATPAGLSTDAKSRRASFQEGSGSSPIASESKHRSVELRGRGAGRLRAFRLTPSNKPGFRLAIAKALRAKPSNVHPSPAFTT